MKMNRTYLFLAIASLAGSAFADSPLEQSQPKYQLPMPMSAPDTTLSMTKGDTTVTLFGRMDMDLQKRVGVDNKTAGQGSNSVWGILASQNLGNGYTAYTTLISDIFPQTGTANTNPGFWGSKAVVGVKSSWGYVEGGRRLTPAWIVAIYGDPFGTYGYTTINNSFLHDDHLFTSARMSNSVSAGYRNNGWFADALVADNKPADFWSTPPHIANASPTATSAGFSAITNTPGQQALSASAGYNKGNLYAGIGYEQTGYSTRALFMTVNYDFGPIKLIASYETGYHFTQTHLRDLKGRNGLIGFSAPMFGGYLLGSYDVLGNRVHDPVTGGYQTFNANNDGGVYSNSHQLGLGYQYPFTKNTFVYTDVAHNRNALNISGVAQSKTGYDVGLTFGF
jgi:predicted porin